MRFFTLAAIASVALYSAEPAEASKKGLAWAADNRWASKIAKGQISWYHHWQNAPVDQMPSEVDYIPMYWGPKYKSLWEKRKSHFAKKEPKYVLAFNEPDVSGQSNMSPTEAAKEYMKELNPLRKKGIKVSSPQIVWNTKWMDSFMKKIHADGGDVDFMAVHYYGTWKDQKRLQKWIKTIHSKYGKNIWLTEYGVTAASHGSAAQIRNFKNKVTAWMDKVGYVDRVAWLGCFATNNPPDSYASAKNGMFTSSGSLNKMAYSYVYKRDADTSPAPAARTTPGAKRHAIQHHKRIIANGLNQAADIIRRNESEPSINGYAATVEDIDDFLAAEDDSEASDADVAEDHCDEICKLRDAETEGTEADDEEDLE
ncbi:hypothetical protein CBS101457_005327 [Exobasidium rhododendri]|nr:hypothetical protein CBS101457_005327 [Exobasidium rhododendri]